MQAIYFHVVTSEDRMTRNDNDIYIRLDMLTVNFDDVHGTNNFSSAWSLGMTNYE